MDYAQLLQRSFETESMSEGECSRLEFLADHVFDFTTYESQVSEIFARRAVEACAAITDRKTFEYIEDDNHRIWFLLMCNMPFFAGRLEWGTSIRGAWWDDYGESMTLESCGLYDEDGEQVLKLTFGKGEWGAFMAAVIAFAAAEMADGALKLGAEVDL